MTAQKTIRMKFAKNKFHTINLPVNMGIGGGVQTGYLYAWRNGYDIAVQFDGDGQHNALYLRKNGEGYGEGRTGHGSLGPDTFDVKERKLSDLSHLE